MAKNEFLPKISYCMQQKLNKGKNMTKKTMNEEHTEDHESKDVEDDQPVLGYMHTPDMRLLQLHGEVNEKIARELVYSLIAYSRIKKLTPMDKKNPPTSFKESTEPVEFLISTPGGSASDMFAIYDTMNVVKKVMDIETIGVGKVMSAGVLLLAAGTKGKRKIGKNCRVMIHSVVGGVMGSSHDIRNEIEELNFTENQYIKNLAKETKMSVGKIREFLGEKKNIYLSANEAVRYGIADIIV
jgi:ATP-dependent Clp protease, protease subunit